MSLEQALKENTEAVLKLVALMEGAKPTGSGSASKGDEEKAETTTTRRGRGRAAKAEAEAEAEETTTKSKYTAEEVKAAAVKVKDTLGTAAARDLIKKHGSDKLEGLKPAVYEAFINDAEALINGDDGNGEEDDDL